MTTQQFKRELARVFDDNLYTKQWHNIVDYAIIGLIILSTIEVFLSTYDGIVERYGTWLKVIDYLTTFCFTIEVSLRIWCADLIDDKYKGFRGRVRYCFSFYGLIDMVFEKGLKRTSCMSSKRDTFAASNEKENAQNP